MKLQLDTEETRELLALILDRLLGDAAFSDEDRAAVRRWQSQSMRPGSAGMRELTSKVNSDIARTLETKARSAAIKPDWR